jgi:predicted transcriptional regulator
MESRPVNRTAWIAAGILGALALLLAAIIFDLGPFADDELSRAEFLAQGDEICSQAHSDYEKLQDSPPRTATEASELTSELLAISREELEAIADLNAPAELTTALERYLDAREAGIERLREGVEAADGGDAFAYAQAQSELASTQRKREGLARDVGFEVCSEVLFGREQLASDSEPPLNTDPSAPPTVNNPPTGTP